MKDTNAILKEIELRAETYYNRYNLYLNSAMSYTKEGNEEQARKDLQFASESFERFLECKSLLLFIKGV